MELEIITSKEEETFIIGVFGLVEQVLNNIFVLWVHLIVNLELKHYLSGKLFVKLLMQPTDHMTLQFCYLMKDMEVDLELLPVI
jgi:hypothetical protein